MCIRDRHRVAGQAEDEIQMRIRLAPVSYTHLDVYKRQVNGHNLVNINKTPLSGLISFSKMNQRVEFS